MPTRFRVGGIRVESQVRLDGLVAADADQRDPQIRVVSLDPVTAQRFDDAEIETRIDVGNQLWMEVRRLPDARLLRWPAWGDFLLPEGDREVRISRHRGVPDKVIGSLFLNQCLSFLLAAYGREGLHGSAVHVPGAGSVLFLGGSGAGKSTLATALAERGASLLADDLVVLRLQDSTPVIDRAARSVRLWPQVARHLVASVDVDTAVEHKVWVGAGPSLELADGIPVCAMFVLEQKGSGAPRISRILGVRNALDLLLGSTYNRLIRTPERLALHFTLLTQLAAIRPMRTIHWSPGPKPAAAMAERVLRYVQTLRPLLPEEASMTQGNEREELVRMLKQAGVSDGESAALDEQLLSTTQVALVLHVTDRAVRAWAESGKIRSIRTLGGRWLFPASAVRAAIESMVGKTS